MDEERSQERKSRYAEGGEESEVLALATSPYRTSSALETPTTSRSMYAGHDEADIFGEEALKKSDNGKRRPRDTKKQTSSLDTRPKNSRRLSNANSPSASTSATPVHSPQVSIRCDALGLEKDELMKLEQGDWGGHSSSRSRRKKSRNNEFDVSGSSVRHTPKREAMTEEEQSIFILNQNDSSAMAVGGADDHMTLTQAQSIFFVDSDCATKVEESPLLGTSKKGKGGWLGSKLALSSPRSPGLPSHGKDLENSKPPQPFHMFGIIMTVVYTALQLAAFGYYLSQVSKASSLARGAVASHFVEKWGVSMYHLRHGQVWRLFTSFFVHTDLANFLVNTLSFMQTSYLMANTPKGSIAQLCIYLLAGTGGCFANGFDSCDYTFGATGPTIGLCAFQILMWHLVGRRTHSCVTFAATFALMIQLITEPKWPISFGGAATGALLAILLCQRKRSGFKRWLVPLASALAALSFVAFSGFVLFYRTQAITSCPGPRIYPSLISRVLSQHPHTHQVFGHPMLKPVLVEPEELQTAATAPGIQLPKVDEPEAPAASPEVGNAAPPEADGSVVESRAVAVQPHSHAGDGPPAPPAEAPPAEAPPAIPAAETAAPAPETATPAPAAEPAAQAPAADPAAQAPAGETAAQAPAGETAAQAPAEETAAPAPA